MPSAVKNTLIPGGAVVLPLVTKVTRGKSTNLGAITAAGDVVAFTISEPVYNSEGGLIIQTTGGVSLTPVLEVSIDGAVTWFTFPVVTTVGVFTLFAITGQPGADTAATFAGQYFIGGLGSGAQFRFGRTDAGGGAATVWVLCG
jgi:hypothetical protein